MHATQRANLTKKVHKLRLGVNVIKFELNEFNASMPERIYNPITAMGFSAMFTFQLDNTKR